MFRKGFLFFVPVLLAVFLACPAGASAVEDDLFARYFSERIRAESVLPVVTATEEELRRGSVPTLTVCLERADIGGVVYDRLLLVLSDVLFTRSGDGIRVHSYSESRLSGNILKKDFLARLQQKMPHYAISELELKDGKVMVFGAYRRKGTFTMNALIRLTGQYVIDGDGKALVRFDDSTNDNPFISAIDVGRAVAKAAPVISFSDFFASPKVTEVRVGHDMVWFSAK
ncbi:hypothetical protein [Aminivibrio sp.]|uniref:hypothetical protein n=1 Tax=Aminivibrio sp. TaxID=1872489 RepID=UPI001A48EDBE|nr:hypothetical protein [Aminivibrio sp.]MBL3539288.1 hypothetical protein [Aminivibrio sp.]MDK2959038.1 hypothetical protein [Synergistaceae bacterium]